MVAIRETPTRPTPTIDAIRTRDDRAITPDELGGVMAESPREPLIIWTPGQPGVVVPANRAMDAIDLLAEMGFRQIAVTLTWASSGP